MIPIYAGCDGRKTTPGVLIDPGNHWRSDSLELCDSRGNTIAKYADITTRHEYERGVRTLTIVRIYDPDTNELIWWDGKNSRNTPKPT